MAWELITRAVEIDYHAHNIKMDEIAHERDGCGDATLILLYAIGGWRASNGGVAPMCDYSLHSVASRPAKVGDKLVATNFTKSITRGFAAVGEPDVAVCLLPGTEVAFEDDVRYQHAFGLFGRARVDHKVARFRQINMHDPHVHHDALEFPGGQIVLVSRLVAGQRATVLQLPAQPITASETASQKRATYVS